MHRTKHSPRVVASLATAVLFGTGLGFGSPAEAQDASERYKVLVANFAPLEGAKDNFGKDIAKELRSALDDLATHQPYEGKEFKDALKKYGLKEEDLAEPMCVKPRQLATQESVQLVLCGTYTPAGVVNAQIIAPSASEVFQVPEFTAEDPEQAAQHIATVFQNYTQALAQSVYCSDYLASQQYQQALEACEKALETDPNSKGALSGRGAALYYLEQKQEALQAFDRVLEIDPYDQNALKFAGIIATELGQPDVGRKHFEEYLSLNPGDANVRLTIAQEMAKAGDFEGALTVVEAGMSGDSANVDLQAYAGGLAIQAAEKKTNEAQVGAATPTEEVPADARPLYEKALQYFDAVVQAKGNDADPAIMRNMLVAHTKLGNTEQAVELGTRAAQLFPQDATLQQVVAVALKDMGRLEEALAALDKAAAADPAAQVNKMKMSWLIEAGRVEEAQAAARATVANNEMPVGDVVTFIAGTGWNEKGKGGQHQEAIKYYELASSVASTAQQRAMPNFFHGYALFQIAIKQNEPSTAASARASLPTFRRAKELLEAAAGYQEQEATRQQLIGQVNEYIVIQEALIKRGR